MSEDNGGKIIAWGEDVTLEYGIMGYAHLLKPDPYQGKNKFKVDCMWPEDNPPKTAMAAIDALARSTWKIGFKDLAYRGIKKGNKIADDYDKRHVGEADAAGKRDGYRGYLVCTPTSRKRPHIIDKRGKPLSDADAENLIYAGAKVRVRVSLGAFVGAEGKGVSLYLKTVQLWPGNDPIEGFGGGGGTGGPDASGFDFEDGGEGGGSDDEPFVLDDDSGSDLFE